MSDSDQVLGEGSNASSTSGGSAYSSPSQQVPQFTLRGQGAIDGVILHKEYQSSTGKKPYLDIIEQPQEHFIFRYKSEKGKHGCIAGRNPSAWPTVKLIGYNGIARIECKLVQINNYHTHPHQLLQNDEKSPCCIVVPNDKDSYIASFSGMIIIHTSKADVENVLFNRHMEKHPTAKRRQMREKIKIIAKSLNLNVVLLKFTARDMSTNEEICSVISEPISNSKSVATNELIIGRYLRTCGRANGGEDMIICTSKISRNNIKVLFFDDDGWSAPANFLQDDVWHQYAIYCRTPPYKDAQITSDVKVHIQLIRPTDGRTSEPKEFIYKADPFFKNIKKRKLAQERTSSSNPTANEIQAASTSEMRREVGFLPQNIIQDKPHTSAALVPCSVQPTQSIIQDIQSYQTTQHIVTELHHSGGQIFENVDPNYMDDVMETGAINILKTLNQSADYILGDNEPINHHLHPPGFEEFGICTDANLGERSNVENDFVSLATDLEINALERTADEPADDTASPRAASVLRGNPMLGQGHPNVVDPREAKQARNMNLQDFHNFMSSSGMVLDDVYNLEMVSDSGGSKEFEPHVAERSFVDPLKIEDESSEDPPAFFTREEHIQVKKLFKEIYNLLQNGSKNKCELRNKLEALCEIRSSDGGTFLSMMLTQSQRGFEHLVTIIHALNISYLLNLTNVLRQTLLHEAVIHDLPEIVTFLVTKGCDPMIQDYEGNNVIHYAVMCKTSIGPLLDAIKSNDIAYEIDASNFERQTPLHLAVRDGWESGVQLLLQHGACHNARDSEGRTPLHLAAYDDHLRVTSALLHSVPPDVVDAVDGRGYTALQIACGGNIRRNTLQIIKELLVKKADPSKCVGSGNCRGEHLRWLKPAQVLARRRPLLWAVVGEYARGPARRPGGSSESEGDFHTAEEDDSEDDIAASLVKIKI